MQVAIHAMPTTIVILSPHTPLENYRSSLSFHGSFLEFCVGFDALGQMASTSLTQKDVVAVLVTEVKSNMESDDNLVSKGAVSKKPLPNLPLTVKFALDEPKVKNSSYKESKTYGSNTEPL
jgi:hypothetical protein